jgi:hypothetical protein
MNQAVEKKLNINARSEFGDGKLAQEGPDIVEVEAIAKSSHV